MGIKLEYAIDLLATSPDRNRFSVHCVNDWDHLQTRRLNQNYQRTGFDKFHNSMDRIFEKHNMESIKKTMQMHENIFKHQVRELHRLYRVQKILTDELKSKNKPNRIWGPLTTTDINHSQLIISQNNSTAQTACAYNFHVQYLRDNNPISSRERSGSCSEDMGTRIKRGFDLERQPADQEYISTRISAVDQDQAGPSSGPQRCKSNKMSTDGSDEDSEVELTLSIGGGSSSKKRSEAYRQPHRSQELVFSHKEIRELDSSESFKSVRGEDFSGPNTPMSSSSTTFDQERNQPHWLLQGLSINRT